MPPAFGRAAPRLLAITAVNTMEENKTVLKTLKIFFVMRNLLSMSRSSERPDRSGAVDILAPLVFLAQAT
jgi:hypothetical protein